ncbi:MAG: sugar-binding protein [Verrucomicrobiales bacterium]|nr:sugar-binding protein [Verrucomicrobiales bacterium]
MKKTQGICLKAAASLAALTFLAGCGDKPESSGAGGNAAPDAGGKPRFAYVTNGVADFWTIAKIGAEKAATDLGVEVDVVMPSGGLSEQKNRIEDLLTRNIDGMAVSPIDAANQTTMLNKAAEVTKLITHDSDAPESNRLVYVGMDNYTAGRMCGKIVKEALPEGGSVMLLVGRLEQDNARLRRQGVIDELLDRSDDSSRFDPPSAPIKGEKYTILGTLTDQFDRAKAKANAEDTLSRYPDIGCLVGLFEYNPPLILQALEQGGKLSKVKVVGFDENPATLQGIRDGTVQGTLVQNPYMYGYKSVEVLKALHEGKKDIIPANKFIDVSAQSIRKDNVMEFWKDLNAKLGKPAPN